MGIISSLFGRKSPVILAGGTEFQVRSVRNETIAASYPKAQPSEQLREAAEYLKANQELPAFPSSRKMVGNSLSDRLVQSDPVADWYLNLPSKIPPKECDAILRMALAGNIWQQTQLMLKMRETWPVFNKCCFELQSSIAGAKYIVHPYKRTGDKKPTKSAEAKADLVRRNLENFRPDRFADEDGPQGMIFDLAGAIINGVAIDELIWDERAIDPDGNPESLVRASAYVHPRNYSFTPDGRIGVGYAAESGFMSLSTQVRGDLMQDPEIFLVAKFKGKSGSPLGSGWMRTLVGMWCMVVYGRDFGMLFMQKYGSPFMDIPYEAGMLSPGDLDELEKLAKQARANGYFIHTDKATLNQLTPHTMGPDNAHMAMMRFADEQCQLLMLGQTLTSATPNKGGSRAQGEVHENVLDQRKEEHCKWIARILTEQFADSLLRVNYGDDYLRNPERPTIEPDLTRPMSASEQADYFVKVGQSTVPQPIEIVYKRASMEVPSPGDTVLISGVPTIMEEPLTATERQQNQLDQQMDAQQKAAEWEPGNLSANRLQIAFENADDSDVTELESLISAAEQAPHKNGEVKAVEAKIKQIMARKRI